MIRINLLAPDRTSKKTKVSSAGPSGPSPLPAFLLLALFAGGALVLCAGAWWFQTNKLENLDKQIAADEKRQKDLQAIQQQVDEFKKKKAILENKVLVIEQLRLSQKSPVHMLDEISKALPDYVWLNNMDQTGGALKFTGQSNSLAAVAEFMTGLQRSGWFPQVELGGSQEQNAIVSFTVNGSFIDPEVAAKEKAAKEAAARAAPPEDTKRPRPRK